MATKTCRACLSRTAALHKTIGVSAGFVQANGGSVQSLQEAGLSDQEGGFENFWPGLNRDARFSMR